MANFQRIIDTVRSFFQSRNTSWGQPYNPEQRYPGSEYRGAPYPQDGYPRQGEMYPPQAGYQPPREGYPPQEYPQQREGYYQPGYPQPGEGYPPQEYQQGGMPQQQQPYPQRSGMNPWMAGGLGALGGGIAGYGLGQAMGDLEQRNPFEGTEGGGDEGGGDFGDFGGE